MFVFRKIWRALFSWNTRFEIRPFALLPRNFRFYFRVFQNYLLFRAASLYAVFLTPDFIELRKPLQIAKYGTYEEIPRWKRCVYVTESRLGMALSSLFVKEKFAAGSYDEVHCVKSVHIRSFFWSLFSRIRTEYGEVLCISPYSVRMRENTD